MYMYAYVCMYIYIYIYIHIRLLQMSLAKVEQCASGAVYCQARFPRAACWLL